MFRASSQAVVAGLLGVLAAAERRGRIVGAAALCCCRFVPAERCYKVSTASDFVSVHLTSMATAAHAAIAAGALSARRQKQKDRIGFFPAAVGPSSSEMDTEPDEREGTKLGSRQKMSSDRKERARTYFKRRFYPFKKAADMDAYCGTKTLLIQFCRDFDECLYYGPTIMVDQFLSEEGLNIATLGRLIKRMKKNHVPSLINLTERERGKAYKSRRESLMTKIEETDMTCGCASFLLTANVDKDGGAFYHGDPEMILAFFSKGLSRKDFETRVNVRPFSGDEGERSAGCSVRHCAVSRHSLPLWRRAAIDGFGFPPDLPFTLHGCADALRQRWAAELDLDPAEASGRGPIDVCSLHFKEGKPTDENPLPAVLLAQGEETVYFGGSKKKPESMIVQTKDADETSDVKKEELKTANQSKRFTQIVLAGRRPRKKPRRLQKKKSKWSVTGKKYSRAYQWSRYHLKRCVSDGLRSRLRCGHCGLRGLRGQRRYYQHFLHQHRPKKGGEKKVCTEKSRPEETEVVQSDIDVSDEESKLVIDEEEEKAEEAMEELEVAPPLHSQVSPLSAQDFSRCLRSLYPSSKVKTMNPRKKYVCAVCKSVCDLFGLFQHMKEVHKGILCQYCLKLFKKVGDLELHMKNHHRVPQRFYSSSQQFAELAGTDYTFLCSACNMVVEFKHLDVHHCQMSSTRRIFDCPFCDRKFPGQPQLEMHLCSGFCRRMTWFAKSQPSPDDVAKLYKVLTGMDLYQTQQTQQNRERNQKKPGEITSKKIKEDSSAFSSSDKNVLVKYIQAPKRKIPLPTTHSNLLPLSGTIFCCGSRGVNNFVKKELRESGGKFDLASVLKDAKLPTTEKVEALNIIKAGKNFILEEQSSDTSSEQEDEAKKEGSMTAVSAEGPRVPPLTIKPSKSSQPSPSVVLKVPPPSKKENKKERRARVANEIYANMLKIKEAVDEFKSSCLFCQQTCFVSVDTLFLLSHLQVVHNQDAVRRILEEDPEYCINRIKRHLKDVRVRDSIFTYALDREGDARSILDVAGGYRCCYCSEEVCEDYVQLFEHVEKVHKSKVLTCHLCQNIFLNFGSYVSHVCFGPPTSQQAARAKFRCKVCRKQDLGTFLDFQFHLRKTHNVCEICLKVYEDQESLYQHCHSHSQELMCMKCFLTYDDHLQFKKHLYYKHESDHKVCRNCHQRTWPHVYHFCIKQLEMTCEVCEKQFPGLRPYRVHMRTHTGENPYFCSSKGCHRSYISRQMLWKHQIRRHPEMRVNATKSLEEKRTRRELIKFKATAIESVRISQGILDDLIKLVVPEKPEEEEKVPEESPESMEKAGDDEQEESRVTGQNKDDEQSKEEEELEEEYDPVDAAVRSIMGPEGAFITRTSPTKTPTAPPMQPPPPPPPLPPPLPAPVQPPVPLPPSAAGYAAVLGDGSSEAVFRASLGGSHAAPQPHQIRSPLAPQPHGMTGMYGSKPVTSIPPPQRGANIRFPVLRHPPNSPGFPGAGLPPLEPMQRPHPSGYRPVIKGDPLKPNPLDDSATDDADEEGESSCTTKRGVVSSIWNQDLVMISDDNNEEQAKAPPPKKTIKTLNPITVTSTTNLGGWHVDLSESSGDEENGAGGPASGPKKARIVERVIDCKVSLRDHDYCYASFRAAQPAEDLSEMGKILSDVAIGSTEQQYKPSKPKKHKRKKDGKKKKKKKKHKKKQAGSSSSSDSEGEIEVTSGPVASAGVTPKIPQRRLSTGPKPKYHTQAASKGVLPQTARPCFSSSSDDEDQAEKKRHGSDHEDDNDGGDDDDGDDDDDDDESSGEIASSDLDTDFEADELLVNLKQIQSHSRRIKPSAKAVEAQESAKIGPPSSSPPEAIPATTKGTEGQKPSLKLKIKLPPKHGGSVPAAASSAITSTATPPTPRSIPPVRARMINTSLSHKAGAKIKVTPLLGPLAKAQPQQSSAKKRKTTSLGSSHQTPLSKKMRESLALNKEGVSDDSSEDSSSDSDDSSSDDSKKADDDTEKPSEVSLTAQQDNRLYCICQSPHDDVSEMIGCDAPDCRIEWFHFECVGIMVPPEGKWYCHECSKKYKIRA